MTTLNGRPLEKESVFFSIEIKNAAKERPFRMGEHDEKALSYWNLNSKTGTAECKTEKLTMNVAKEENVTVIPKQFTVYRLTNPLDMEKCKPIIRKLHFYTMQRGDEKWSPQYITGIVGYEAMKT